MGSGSSGSVCVQKRTACDGQGAHQHLPTVQQDPDPISQHQLQLLETNLASLYTALFPLNHKEIALSICSVSQMEDLFVHMLCCIQSDSRRRVCTAVTAKFLRKAFCNHLFDTHDGSKTETAFLPFSAFSFRCLEAGAS